MRTRLRLRWRTCCRIKGPLAGRSGQPGASVSFRYPRRSVCAAATAGSQPVCWWRRLAEEELLRGGARRIEACLLVEALRVQDAERMAGMLSTQLPAATIGVYRLLCEIKAKPG